MKRSTYLLLLPLMLLMAKTASAQWPIGKYRDELVTSLSYYGASDSWDANGNRISGNGRQFNAYSFGLYNVYGLTRSIDIEASVPLVYLQNKAPNGSIQKNYGAGDLMAGLNFNLYNGDFTKYLNLTVSGIVPLYNVNQANNDVGYGEAGAEAKLAFFANISPDFIKGSYFTVDAAYRKYFGTDGPDQYTGTVIFGLTAGRDDHFIISGAYIRSVSVNKAFNPLIVNIKDFQYVKASFTYGHTFSRRVSMYLLGFVMPYGQNTGIGYGANLSTVFRL